MQNFILFTTFFLTLDTIYSQRQKLVTIPFHRKKEISSSMPKMDIIKDLKNTIFVTEIKMGTPYQSLTLTLRSDTHFAYVYSYDAYFRGNDPEDLVGFKESESTTYKQIAKITTLAFIFKDAYSMQDNAQIGSATLENLNFILGLDISDSKDASTDSGSIGFDLINSYDTAKYQSNLIKSLKEKGVIDSYDYFIEFDNLNSGRIVIGGEPNAYNSNKYKNKMNSFARLPHIGSNLNWGFIIDKVSYDEQELNGTFSYVYIQFEAGIISVGQIIKDILDQKYFNSLIRNNICEIVNMNTTTTNYVCQKGKFDPSKLGKLSLYNMEFEKTFEVDLSKMFLDVGNDSYFLVQFTKDNNIILGRQFIMDYPIVFNQDNKMIGIYNPIFEVKKENKGLMAILVVLIVIASIVVVSLILLLVYKSALVPRRKRGTELIDDDYEYIPSPASTNLN